MRHTSKKECEQIIPHFKEFWMVKKLDGWFWVR